MRARKTRTVGHQSLILHKKLRGKIETHGKVSLKNKKNLTLTYTPGVAAVSEFLSAHPHKAIEYSMKRNSVAVISDGSAVLGLGNIGPYGALPVMEGKALIFKEFANVDAWPIVLNTQDTDEIVKTVLAIAPTFGGINLEDIAAPKCFEIERRLIEALDIPVMHDDQHGTAIVVLAGLINACKVTARNLNTSRVVVQGTGAAGSAVMRLIKKFAPRVEITALDSKGIISKNRKDLSNEKKSLLHEKIISGGESSLTDAFKGADVFIGLSKGNVLQKEDIKRMNTQPIIFALANPIPEIMPDLARAAGASVVATGRSDFPNQVNNALVFPGVFRGAFDHRVRRITDTMKLRAAKALAGLVAKPSAQKVIPDIFDKRVVKTVAKTIR